MRFVLAFVLVSTTFANAQEQPYTPPDRQLWDMMSKALAELNLPLAGHQQIQQILINVQREAQARDAAKKEVK